MNSYTITFTFTFIISKFLRQCPLILFLIVGLKGFLWTVNDLGLGPENQLLITVSDNANFPELNNKSKATNADN